MSNPTSNFGWQMPTSTDLVTDLPADFEVFGQAVDTSLADLKGGTTGQVLSKNSNTDMDFVWVTDAAGDITGVTAGTGISGGGTSGTVTITNSMATEITAKGDLIVGTGSATFDNLAAGSNGSILVADSSTSTGLRYTAGNPIPNPVINSCFDIWQRGTSFTTTAMDYDWTADRWFSYAYGVTSGRTISRQATSDTTNLPNIQYCARVGRNSGDTNTGSIQFFNPWETANSIPYAGKTVTVSFYARKGANYSPTSSYLRLILQSGTGTDQNPIAGYTGGADVIDQSAVLTTTWQRFSYTGTVPATQTELSTCFIYTPTGTAGAADYYEITGVQVDIGSVALPVRRNGATIQGELAACQRYYWRTGTVTTNDQVGGAWGYGVTGTYARFLIRTPVTMRVPPTSTDYNAVDLTDPAVGALTGTTITSQTYTADAIQFVLSSSGTVNGRYMYYTTARSSASYLGFSAEL